MLGKISALTLIAALLCLCESNAVLAANDAAQKAALANRANRPVSADMEYKAEKLTAPVPLPNVPMYTGKSVFISGLRYPNDRSGQRYGMTYGVNEDPSAVKDWYRQSLKMYNWTVLDTSNSTDSDVIGAHLNNVSLSIRVKQSTNANYRTVVVISYKAGK